MKQVNFSHPGGFPLEQETLERLQTAYRSELFGALKSHLSIRPDYDYVVAPATNEKEGWAIIHPKDSTGVRIPDGILYPIQKSTPTGFLKTTRTGTNLVYGTGVSQTAYFDYEAQYISPEDYANRPLSSQITDALTVHYYDLATFKVVKDLQTVENILQTIETNIDLINQTYLPLDGSKAMKGDLDLGPYKLSKLDIKDSATANVRVTDFRLGSALGRAIVNDSTNLTLNYGSDWQNTSIGGKVYLENLNTSDTTKSLLVIDNSNQVTKNNTLIDSLLSRITALENKPTTAVPIGMVAIWGKPAPFPEGWEEYKPLVGKMPVGLYNPTAQEISDQQDGDGGNGITYYRDSFGSAVFPFDTLGNTGGRIGKILKKENIPPLDVILPVSAGDNSGGDSRYVNATDIEYAGEKKYSGAVNNGNIAAAIDILNPYRVVQFIEYTGLSSDQTAPTSPTNLKASNIGTKSLTLNWTASTDNVGVTNYLIYKESILLEIVDSNVFSFPVAGLTAGTSYNFSVIARDAAGNLSTPATLTQATIAADLIAPTVPSYLHCVHNGQGYIQVEWGPSQDDDSPIDYELSRSDYGSLFTVLKKNPSTYYNEKVSTNGTYTYRIRAIDPSGNSSAYKEASITISSL